MGLPRELERRSAGYASFDSTWRSWARVTVSLTCDGHARFPHHQPVLLVHIASGHLFATVEAMRLFMIALLPLLTCLPLAAQDSEAQKFAGTWQAKLKDKVICTLKLKAGEQISGETEACSINVDANGDLQERDFAEPSDASPAPILNAKLQGDALLFEEQNGDEVLKFEMKLVGDGGAELRILDAPVPIKPIRFERR